MMKDTERRRGVIKNCVRKRKEKNKKDGRKMVKKQKRRDKFGK